MKNSLLIKQLIITHPHPHPIPSLCTDIFTNIQITVTPQGRSPPTPATSY